jgi:hypothetical protein
VFGPLHNLNFCEVDGFPLVKIDDEVYCSAEYTDGLIGGQAVTGIEERGDRIELIFDSGLRFPLTCPCCDGPLHRQFPLADVRRIFRGRTLEGFRHGEYVGGGTPPERHPIFALQFSGPEDPKHRTLEVGLGSVRGLRPDIHPH